MAIVVGATVVTADETVAIVRAIIAAGLLLAIAITMTRITIVGRHLRVIAVVVPDPGPDLHPGMIVEAEVLVVGIITMTVVGIVVVTAVGIAVEIVGGAIVLIAAATALEVRTQFMG